MIPRALQYRHKFSLIDAKTLVANGYRLPFADSDELNIFIGGTVNKINIATEYLYLSKAVNMYVSNSKGQDLVRVEGNIKNFIDGCG